MRTWIDLHKAKGVVLSCLFHLNNVSFRVIPAAAGGSTPSMVGDLCFLLEYLHNYLGYPSTQELDNLPVFIHHVVGANY